MGLLKLLVLFAVMASSASIPRPTERVLDIPWSHQQHNLSCEAAALRMALSYYKISAGETTLIGLLTRDSRPARFDTRGNHAIWGDHASGFVGNPDGRTEHYKRYGVFYQPVAPAAWAAG